MPGLYWIFHVWAASETCADAGGDDISPNPIASAATARKRSTNFKNPGTCPGFLCSSADSVQLPRGWSAKPHTRATSIAVDKLYAGCFQCTADRQIVSRCHGGPVVHNFGTLNRIEAQSRCAGEFLRRP